MRNSVAAIALIGREVEGKTVWLARWNRNSNAYSFVGGHKQPEESFRDCLIRHVCDVLGLEADADYLLAEKPHSHLEYVGWSEGPRAETAYTMELYELTLTGDFSLDKVDGDGKNRWLDPAEIQAASTKDGKPISATMNLLMQMAGLFDENPPDSSH